MLETDEGLPVHTVEKVSAEITSGKTEAVRSRVAV
jgi:hypothetical protein